MEADMMRRLIDILHTGNHSLAVENGEVVTFDGRGVSDLYRLLNDNSAFLEGASVADKVVGKGAAALMILGKVRRVHADVISVPALELFRTSPVDVTYDRDVPHIINRRGDGVCPVETLCMACATAADCLPGINDFMKSKQ